MSPPGKLADKVGGARRVGSVFLTFESSQIVSVIHFPIKKNVADAEKNSVSFEVLYDCRVLVGCLPVRQSAWRSPAE